MKDEILLITFREPSPHHKLLVAATPNLSTNEIIIIIVVSVNSVSFDFCFLFSCFVGSVCLLFRCLREEHKMCTFYATERREISCETVEERERVKCRKIKISK